MQPKISIIIPIYNVEKKLLCKCLDSLLDQSLKDIELVCVLDCPTDGTDKIVDEYAQRDYRIRVVRNEQNLHIGESRNRGIKASTGEFVGFFDDDDYCSPDMYMNLYKAAKKDQTKVAFCDRSVEIADNGETIIFRDEKNADISHCIDKILSNDNNNSAILVWNYIYDRKFIEENSFHFIDTKRISAEDAMFNVTALLLLEEKGEKISYLPQALYHHIYHKGNTGATMGYLDKLPIFRNELTKLIFNRYDTPKNRHNTHIGNITILYRIIRLHIKKEGIINAWKLLKSMIDYKEIVKLQKTEFRLWDKGLTPPKNLFNWLLRILS